MNRPPMTASRESPLASSIPSPAAPSPMAPSPTAAVSPLPVTVEAATAQTSTFADRMLQALDRYQAMSRTRAETNGGTPGAI